jgi:hypothetical protein
VQIQDFSKKGVQVVDMNSIVYEYAKLVNKRGTKLFPEKGGGVYTPRTPLYLPLDARCYYWKDIIIIIIIIV